MASKTHVFDRIEDRKLYASDAEGVPHVVALCGEAKAKERGFHRDYFQPLESTPLESISCPKCSAARALQILAETPDHGLSISKYEPQRGYRQPYRSAYELRRNADLIGFVVYDGGWRGGSWKVTCLNTREADRDTVEMGFEMDRRVPREPTPRNPDTYTSVKPRLASKEAAMVFALELAGEGRMKTAAENVQWYRDYQKRLADGAARRAAEEAEEARVTAETIEGLREIVVLAEGGQLLLTNFQKTAVENALLLGFKVASREPVEA